MEEMVEVVGLLRGQTAEAASQTKAIQEQKKALAIHSGLDDHDQTVITKKFTIKQSCQRRCNTSGTGGVCVFQR